MSSSSSNRHHHHRRRHYRDQRIKCQKVEEQVVEKSKVAAQTVAAQAVVTQAVTNGTVTTLSAATLEVESQTVERLTAEEANVNVLNVVGSVPGEQGVLNVSSIRTQDLFINNKLFPTSIIPFKISSTSVIVGPGGSCAGSCGPATPGTPTGGKFVLGNSFQGKITFCGVNGVILDLVGLVLSNDNDFALEFINCRQVYVFGGSINSANATAVRVSCCSDVTFSNLNTSNSARALFIEDTLDVKIQNWYMANIASTAIVVTRSRYMRFGGLDVNNITSMNERSLLDFFQSDMIFINNCVFYNIAITEAASSKSVIRMEECFDVKVSHISILSTSITGAADQDLMVALVYFQSCGSLVLGSFIIDGDRVVSTGTGDAIFYGLLLQETNNVFMAHHLMTDNQVIGGANASKLEFAGVGAIDVETMTMNSSKICTNYAQGGNADETAVKVRSFFGAERFTGLLRSGNWYLSGNICNQNYINSDSFYASSTVYGFDLENVSFTVVFQKCSANNSGNALNSVAIAGGFRVQGIDAANNVNTNINFFGCAANQCKSNDEAGSTVAFYSSYSNTMIVNCEANSNMAGADCVGFFLPGLQGSSQSTVSVFNCTANTNKSATQSAYGVFAGNDVAGSVSTVVIKKCTFSANTGVTTGYGVLLKGVAVSSLIGNLINQNDCGLCLEESSAASVESNSFLNNTTGVDVKESADSIFEKNISQSNTVGYTDNTPGGNTYYSNKSVSNTTAFNMVGFTIPLFALNKATGTFTFVSGEPTLGSYTNLSS